MFDSSWFKEHLYQIIETGLANQLVCVSAERKVCANTSSVFVKFLHVCTQINIHVDCKVHLSSKL